MAKETKKLTDAEMEISLQTYLFADQDGKYTEHIDTTPEETDPMMYESVFTDKQREFHAKVMEKHNLSDSTKSAEAKKKKLKNDQDIRVRNENIDRSVFAKTKRIKTVQVCKINAGNGTKRTKEEQEQIDNFNWDSYIEKQARLRAARPKKNYCSDCK